MKNLIANKEQFENFTQNVLPPLDNGEVYFVSLSFRNKYLTEEEREYYKLGRTEMFGRTIVRSQDDWYFYMKKLASHLEYRTTKSGLEYPDKALVVYVNINPSNMIIASQNFAKEVSQITSEMVRSYMVGSGNPNLKSLDKADRLFMNHVQKATGHKTWLDIDVDCKDERDVGHIVAILNGYGVKHHKIKTKSGFHILVNRESLKHSKLKNLHEQVFKANERLQKLGGECVFNRNAMVPMVGTLQDGFLVELIY